MPDLNFQVASVAAVPFAAEPLLAFQLQISNTPAAEPIQAVALRCQIRIEATRRRYGPETHARLLDLFGEPCRNRSIATSNFKRARSWPGNSERIDVLSMHRI